MKRQATTPSAVDEKQFQYYTAIHIGVVVKEVPGEDASFVYMEGTTPYGKFPFDKLSVVLDKDLTKCYHSRATSHYTHGGPYQPLMRGTWVVVAYASHANVGVILGTIPDRRRNILPKNDASGMLYHHHSGVWLWIHNNGDIELAHPSVADNKWSFIKIGKEKTLSSRFRQIVQNEHIDTVEYKLGDKAPDIKPVGAPWMGFFHNSGAEISIAPDGTIYVKSAVGKTVQINPDTPPNGDVCDDCPSLRESSDVFVNGLPVVVNS